MLFLQRKRDDKLNDHRRSNEQDKHAYYLRREFAYTNFEQKYSLPDNVDEAKIAAKVEDGILTIELPKIQREEGKTSRQIAIK